MRQDTEILGISEHPCSERLALLCFLLLAQCWAHRVYRMRRKDSKGCIQQNYSSEQKSVLPEGNLGLDYWNTDGLASGGFERSFRCLDLIFFSFSAEETELAQNPGELTVKRRAPLSQDRYTHISLEPVFWFSLFDTKCYFSFNTVGDN